VTQNQGIPWLRIGAESAAIVASILLAFGIDAWWNSRVAQSETSLLLDALESEWESDLEKIDFTLDQITRFRRASEKVIASYRQGSYDLSAEDAEAFLRAQRFRTFKASLGALNTLLSSSLDNISDPELRRAIASWPSVLDEIAPEEGAILEITLLQYQRALARVSLGLSSESEFDPSISWANLEYGIDSGALALAAIEDEEFMTALTNRFGITMLYEVQLVEIRRILEENLALIALRQ
jgi:hypothetical protein